MKMNITKSIQELSKSDVASAGGKGASLGEMIQAGINVPPGFVVLSSAFEAIAENLNLFAYTQEVFEQMDVEDSKSVVSASEKIRTFFLNCPIPAEFEQEILDNFQKLNAQFVAVRSSATSEDSANAAWAGQLETYLNTTADNLLEHIRRCWASLFTPRAITYRFEQKMDTKNISVAVVVQKMIESEKSGVAFSVHPVLEDKNKIIIEAAYGLGEAVVSGVVTPDMYVVDKRDYSTEDIQVHSQTKALYRTANGGNEWLDLKEKGEEQILSEEEIVELAKMVEYIERHYGFPCDIEWAKDKECFYMLQARPITTLTFSASAQNTSLDKANKKDTLDLRELYKTQISFTEWFEAIDHKLSKEMRAEDNEKRERLATLNRILDIPFDKPVSFTAEEVENNGSNFQKYMSEHGDELCAMRLIPIDPALPKLRMRGHTLREVVADWYPAQEIDPARYRVDFVPHSAHSTWSTIFVINDHGIFGEIISGTHAQLTQGFFEADNTPIIFHSDFVTLKLNQENEQARQHVEQLIDFLYVRTEETRNLLKQELNSDFSHDYVKGYFETVASEEFGIWFCDYNRLLGTLFNKFTLTQKSIVSEQGKSPVVAGQSTGGGTVRGIVRIVHDPSQEIEAAEILVCRMTTPEYVPLIKKAAAIITDYGGVLSHAAIVSRELGKPCIVGTQQATLLLKDGDTVEIDSDRGNVYLI